MRQVSSYPTGYSHTGLERRFTAGAAVPQNFKSHIHSNTPAIHSHSDDSVLAIGATRHPFRAKHRPLLMRGSFDEGLEQLFKYIPDTTKKVR